MKLTDQFAGHKMRDMKLKDKTNIVLKDITLQCSVLLFKHKNVRTQVRTAS